MRVEVGVSGAGPAWARAGFHRRWAATAHLLERAEAELLRGDAAAAEELEVRRFGRLEEEQGAALLPEACGAADAVDVLGVVLRGRGVVG